MVRWIFTRVIEFEKLSNKAKEAYLLMHKGPACSDECRYHMKCYDFGFLSLIAAWKDREHKRFPLT